MTADRQPPDRSDDFDRGVANRRAVLGDEWVDRLARRRERVQRRLPEPDHALRLARDLGPPRPRPRDAAPARPRHDDGDGALGGVRAALPRRDRAAACRSRRSRRRCCRARSTAACRPPTPPSRSPARSCAPKAARRRRNRLPPMSRVAAHHTFSAPQLRVTVQGQGPPVVLSHALGLDLHMWDDARGAPRRRATPCCATTSAATAARRGPPGPYAMDELVDDAARLIREWGRGPVAFIGLSMGGMVGQGLADPPSRAAARRRARQHGRALPGGGAADVGGADRRGRARRHGGGRRRRRRALPARRLPRRASGRRRRRCARACCAADPAGYVAACHAVANVDWLDRLASVRLPTLVLAGARDAGATPEMAKAIADRIAGAELRVFDDASHLSVVEAGDEFHGAVSSFLASLPPPR